MHCLESDSPCTFNFPELRKIKQQAKFLTKFLDIAYSDSLEMMAFYYSCDTWEELKICAEISQPPPKFTFLSGSGVDHKDADILRNELNELICGSKNISDQLSKLKKMPLLPYTISHSISNLRLDWLLDDEVSLIMGLGYGSEYVGSEFPLYDITKTLDNSILTKIYFMKESRVSETSGDLYDYRYGLRIYYKIYLFSFGVRIAFRELDSFFKSPTKDLMSPRKQCNKPWFGNYIEGYIFNTISVLRKNNIRGEILLCRINNRRCGGEVLDEPRYDVSGFYNLIDRLVSKGAKRVPYYHDEDISIPF